MKHGLSRPARVALSTVFFALAAVIWAASLTGGAALLSLQKRTQSNGSDRQRVAPAQSSRPSSSENQQTRTGVPRPASFREVEGRGLLVKVWVNEAGPYRFAVDTGAGATILSRRVAMEARVGMEAGRAMEIGGLSGAGVRAGRKAFVRAMSIGDRWNALNTKGLFIVAEGLPEDIDGVLDPTETFWPLGYVVDIPRGELSAFDPRLNPLRRGDATTEGTVVAWLTDATSRRPFVMLAGGRRALIDTGSGFGLAVTENSARALGIRIENPKERAGVLDIGGGRVAARRIAPATINIGSLALRGVPTDLLSGAESGAPILLGLDALRPFQLTFDPSSKLIRIEAR